MSLFVNNLIAMRYNALCFFLANREGCECFCNDKYQNRSNSTAMSVASRCISRHDMMGDKCPVASIGGIGNGASTSDWIAAAMCSLWSAVRANQDWSDERSAEHRRRARLNDRTKVASRTWVAGMGPHGHPGGGQAWAIRWSRINWMAGIVPADLRCRMRRLGVGGRRVVLAVAVSRNHVGSHARRLIPWEPIAKRGCPSECGWGRLQVRNYNGLRARRWETTTGRRYRTQMDTPLAKLPVAVELKPGEGRELLFLAPCSVR